MAIKDDVEFGRSLVSGRRTVMTTMTPRSNSDRYESYRVLLVKIKEEPIDIAFRVSKGLGLQNDFRSRFKRASQGTMIKAVYTD